MDRLLYLVSNNNNNKWSK